MKLNSNTMPNAANNTDLTRTLQDINRAANSLETFSHSAFGNASRLDDVLMMLRELEQLHSELKQAMEAQAEPTNRIPNRGKAVIPAAI